MVIRTLITTMQKGRAAKDMYARAHYLGEPMFLGLAGTLPGLPSATPGPSIRSGTISQDEIDETVKHSRD
jgi:hypothetical protein